MLRRPHSRRSRQSTWHISRPVNVLRALWLASLFSGEAVVFYLSVHACDWPVEPVSANVCFSFFSALSCLARHSCSHRRIQSGPQTAAFKLLIVSDPQIPDSHSYADRPWLLNSLSRLIIDNYARKVWRQIIAMRSPDAIVFLGDLLDSGVLVTDEAECALSLLLIDALGTHLYSNRNSQLRKLYLEISTHIFASSTVRSCRILGREPRCRSRRVPSWHLAPTFVVLPRSFPQDLRALERRGTARQPFPRLDRHPLSLRGVARQSRYQRARVCQTPC
jgi:hypothetical protein